MCPLYRVVVKVTVAVLKQVGTPKWVMMTLPQAVHQARMEEVEQGELREQVPTSTEL